MGDRVRCPRCSRVIAVRVRNGSLEVRRRGKLVAVVVCGSVSCEDCGSSINVSHHEAAVHE